MRDRERISMLEREVQDLRRSMDRMTVRNPSTAPVKNARLARTVNGGTTYPSTGQTFYIEFLDGSYTKSPGNQTPTLVARQAVNFSVCHNIAGTMPAEGTKLHVFEWRGHWWTYWAEGDTSSSGSTEWLTTNFSSSGSITPDTQVASTESKIIDFTNAVTTGSVTGVSFDGTNKWTMAAGTYLIIWNVSCDIEQSGGEVYSPGEEFTDNLYHAAARIYLIDSGGSQYAEQGGYVTVSAPYEMTQTTGDQHRLVLASSNSIQLKMTHENTTASDNPDVRVFHAKMHIIKFA